MTALGSRPYKVTAAHRAHVGLNATWTEIGHWRVVDSFGNAQQEADGARQAVGVQDVSPIGKLDLKGAGVAGLLGRSRQTNGTAGGWIATLSLKPGHALVLTEPGRKHAVREALLAGAGASRACVHATDVTSGISAYALVGPLAMDVLNRLTPLDVRRDRFVQHACAQCDLAHVHATVYREDWGDLPAYLVLVSRDVGEYVWDVILNAGGVLRLRPFGLAAERLLRKTASRDILSPVS
jgi:sarcosine oxidase subunit alpha